MRLLPMYDRVLVKREAETKTAGGLFIPETSEDAKRSDRGRVVAVGRGKRLASGAIAEPIVKVGDRIVFNKHRGVKVDTDNGECVILFEDDVLAVCE